MQIQLLILSICITVAVGYNCNGYSDFLNECNNNLEQFHELVDTSLVNQETACQVAVRTSRTTCQAYCQSQNKVCIAAQDNSGTQNSCSLSPEHTRQTTDENGCLQQWQAQICICDEPAEIVDPCQGFTGYDKQCYNTQDDFSSLVDGSVVQSPSACQVLVSTNGTSCNDYCTGQGSVCVAAQDNTNSSCNLDSNHQRQTTDDNGCQQTWGNQICICDQPQPEPEVEEPDRPATPSDPCDNYSDYEQICANTSGDFNSLVDGSVVDSPTACQVLVQTSRSTCNDYCSSQGYACVAAQDNTGNSCNLDDRHDRKTTEDNGCQQAWGNQICVCDTPEQQVDPEEPIGACSDYSDYFSQCFNGTEDFHADVNTTLLSSETACQVQVQTQGQTCSQYCSSQNAVCIAAQDNVDNTCVLDGRHTRQRVDNNGCNQSWGNQVCVCDRHSIRSNSPCSQNSAGSVDLSRQDVKKKKFF